MSSVFPTMVPVKAKVVLSLALELIDRLILTAAKAILLFKAIVVFLPLIFRAA